MGGPFVRETGDFYGFGYTKRTWRTQAKPYVKPLEYEFWAQGSNSGTLPAYNYQPVLNPNLSESTWSGMLNKTVKRFQEQVGEAASVAVSAAEYGQSRNMIVKRVTQMTRAARQIRKGNFKGAARTFGITQPKGATRKKQFADNWLEFTFGWVPAIKDCFAAAAVFSREIPNKKIFAQGKTEWRHIDGNWPPRTNTTSTSVYTTYQERLRIGCHVQVTNPDLFLANQLGLLNPASVAWELVPFSFVVDWFTDFGSYLESLTFGLGLTLTNQYQTRSTRLDRQYVNTIGVGIPGVGTVWHLEYHVGFGFVLKRTLSIPGMVPAIPPFSGFSIKRGITAISLLIQQLR